MKFIKLSDVVDELSALRREHDRLQWLTYMIAAKSALKDHKIIYLNDFKRVYLVVNQETMTVRIPDDYYRFRTISVIQDCFDRYGRPDQKVIPLTLNPYINITPVTPAIDACKAECNCEINHPVCQELANYTSICEEVILDNASPPTTGIKQTVIRTCANGDIVKEVSQPTQQYIQGTQVCDYDMNISVVRPVCNYNVDFKTGHSFLFPFTVSFTINGNQVTSESLADEAALNSFMLGLGWSIDEAFVYSYFGINVYAPSFTVTDVNGEVILVVHGTCYDQNVLTFPYTIISYNKNGSIITESPALLIEDQADQDAFFTSLGFTKIDDTHYSIEGSPDTYFNIAIQKITNVCSYAIDFADFDFSAYPYTISYTLNGESLLSPILTNDDEMFDFFFSLGFVFGGIGMELIGTSQVFGDTFTQNISPPIDFSNHKDCTTDTVSYTLNFVQLSCNRPLISNGIHNVLSTELLCNVDLKKCGCIAETPSNITKIVECCAPFLQCCQAGELSNWAGWGYVPSCCPTNTPQPYNLKGTYNLDEHNYTIYLDSVAACKVLLAYDDDGSCNGEYFLPEYCMDSMKAGVAYYHAQYDEEISPQRRRELEINYDKMLSKLERFYTDPIRMADLVEALKSKSVM